MEESKRELADGAKEARNSAMTELTKSMNQNREGASGQAESNSVGAPSNN